MKIVIPLPSYGFDPTEVAIPWKLLSEQHFEIVFATPQGKKAVTDTIMLKGNHLGIWKLVLQAKQDAIKAYNEMEKSEAFCNPINYTDINERDYDALLLPGGHDKGVKEYLESALLQQLVVDFFMKQKTVAAICHGVVLLARSIDPVTKKSVIHHYKTTSLLKSQELLAYTMTKLWMKDYYLTYQEITVEDEVRAALSDSKNFIKGPPPLFRDDLDHLSRGFFVKDRNYLSARWPGDAYTFSLEFIKMLRSR
jgi:putative intracellular protease/amidase